MPEYMESNTYFKKAVLYLLTAMCVILVPFVFNNCKSEAKVEYAGGLFPRGEALALKNKCTVLF